MALEKGRNLFKNLSEPLVSRLEGVNPATLTWLTLPTGLAAAWLMMEAGEGQEGALMFFGAAVLMATAMALDGLDGNLARATGQVTRWGDYLDHTLDRVLDVVWILALGYNMIWFGHVELAWIAAMLTMFGSYLGTQAQAVAGSRNYGGFSRADRMVLTVVALLSAALMAYMDAGSWGEWSGIEINPISIILGISGLGGIYTFIIRFIKARKELQSLDLSKPLSKSKGNDSNDE
ncbi:CDP-alcohol phosphatidyltransferase family protein [Candidatus Poseidoniaceae archaeon]|jgi:phosphatidylglycerophosphate synthase|nr:CDP-alcohol phosphatidyltransferase family protein [Candidatus Poseidoniaceae archaeon]MDC3339725.1 CDP-alcohol phosphatidyltransferase family protein [bacterium]